MKNEMEIIDRFRDLASITVENVINGILIFFEVKIFLNKSITNADPKEVLNALKQIGNANYSDYNEKNYYDLYKLLDTLNNKELLEIIDAVKKMEIKTKEFAVLSQALLNIMFNIKSDKRDILLVNVENYGSYVYDFIAKNQTNRIYFSCANDRNMQFYKKVLEFENVSFVNGKVYDENFTIKKFDYIVCFPPFGSKIKKDDKSLISDDISLVYAQSLLYYLKEGGVLRVVLPSKVGFAGGDVGDFREYINNNYKINSIYMLTSNVFKPYMMFNTYYMELTTGVTDNIEIKKISRNKTGEIIEELDKLVFKEEFEELSDWNIESLMSEKSQAMIKYEHSNVRKEGIKEVANVLKGKTITRKDIDGNLKVINIANINDGEIDYSNLDSIEDDEIKNARYVLEDGDILISARGTIIKIAIYNKQSFSCIASSNINVIRCNKEVMNSSYMKLFLESNVGMELLNSIKRGSIILNINYKDIEIIKVPVPPIDEQNSIIKEYEEGKRIYEEKVNAAKEAWNKIKSDVENQLY